MKRVFILKGLDCPNCSAKIEKEVGELDGVTSSTVNLMNQTLTVQACLLYTSICGFIGAGGGMMMLLILTSVLGYELKNAVGTSVFIMAFTALTGAVSHFMIGGAPNWFDWALCVVFTLLWARIAAVFANKADPCLLYTSCPVSWQAAPCPRSATAKGPSCSPRS